MPWRIGLDEAGYGPNLGPFVMTAVACQVPDDLLQANLWKTLRKLVRQARHEADQRLLIDDSKKVYAGGKGLADLEIASLLALDSQVQGLGELLPLLCPIAPAELNAECWFTGQTPLPLAADSHILPLQAARWKELCVKSGITWLAPCSEIVCASRFNSLIDRYDSKGAVLSLCFVRLIQSVLQASREREASAKRETPDCPADPIHITVDKHGGRNHYSAVLQDAFPDGWVVAREESLLRSSYEVLGLDRPVHITFRVEADAHEMTVALASMISKYLREALMSEWNAFWQKEVPGIRPTAGYPGDARRFYEEIQPAMQRLTLTETQIWRKR